MAGPADRDGPEDNALPDGESRGEQGREETPAFNEPPRRAPDTHPLNPVHPRRGRLAEEDRPSAAVLQETRAALDRRVPGPPSPQDETGRVRLVPQPHEPRPWRIIFQTVHPHVTRIGLNVWQALVIGRADTQGSQQPDLDMSPHGGDEMGVSRQHAVLIPGHDALYLADLDSTNGTWINGRYLEPGRWHPLAPGDRIDLGLLRLEVRSVGPLRRMPPEATG